jgi:hypothetical protein
VCVCACVCTCTCIYIYMLTHTDKTHTESKKKKNHILIKHYTMETYGGVIVMKMYLTEIDVGNVKYTEMT